MKARSWAQALDCRPGDVISIIGSGGKTSLLYALGQELAASSRVLLTTTTKMWIPQDFSGQLILSGQTWAPPRGPGMTLLGQGLGLGKIRGLDPRSLAHILPFYDYVLIEADGARNKPYTLWKPWEPVVLEASTKTIGVLPIKGLGQAIEEDNFYYRQGLEGFSSARYLTEDFLVRLVREKMFARAQGAHYLFINQVETAEEEAQASRLAHRLAQPDLTIIQASIKEGRWK